MTLSLNKPKLDNLAGDIWKSAPRRRGKFTGGGEPAANFARDQTNSICGAVDSWTGAAMNLMESGSSGITPGTESSTERG